MRRNESANQAVFEAVKAGRWRDPGPEALRRILGESLDLPDLELFASEEVMQRVKDQVDSGGYVDDPEFCMVRSLAASPPRGNRLVFNEAVFIAGSVDPGDDVFVVAEGDVVKVFDWRQTPPGRWVNAGSLEGFVDALAAGG